MPVTSKSVPNLVQGVSQQSAQQRRDSQCESQFDCMNSPKDGAWARHGFDVVKAYPGQDLRDSFPYELNRARQEHYLVLARAAEKGGFTVLNLDDGAVCSVRYEADAMSYLALGGRPAEDSFCAQTVNDATFFANRSVSPAMADDLSGTRPREALVFFKAGGYLSTYAISLLWAGVTYRWLYQTPDNSSPGNAAYIATNYLAAIFYRAMTGTAPSGGGGTGQMGAVYNGDPGPGGVGKDNSTGAASNPTVQSLGFSMAINGNILRIWRNDGQNFTIDTSDSVGDTYLTCFKDTVRSFGELPKNGFEGLTLKVQAKAGQDGAADYWVEYVNRTAASGYWSERNKPGVPYILDPYRMPHPLVNEERNKFVFTAKAWSTRIAGDGEFSAKDPGFVGHAIQDLFYHKGRLAILTEGTVDFSKARNPFTYFPDTVQTVLADANIGLEITASDSIALMRRAAKVDESLFLWAQGTQFRITSNNDPFKQDTVEANDSTAYEFAEKCNFARVGASLYFATEPNGWATLRNLTFNQGRAVGDTDVTAHVSEYVSSGVRRLSPSDTGQLLFVRTDGEPTVLALYNYLVQDRTVVQSAWSKWRIPCTKVIWAGVYRLDLLVLVQRADGAVLLRTPLSARAVDDGVPGAEYRTRLDLRVSEAGLAYMFYDPASDTTTLGLPFQFADTEASRIRVVSRASTTDRSRGRQAAIVYTAGNVVRVQGDWTATPLYVGLAVTSERTESTFYLRTESGVVPTDSLNIRQFNVRFAATGYSRIEVNIGAGRPLKVHETKNTTIGSDPRAVGAPPVISSGVLESVVDTPHEQVSVRLVNDTWLPSRWQTAEWRYEAVLRAKNGGAGSRGAGE